MHIERIRELADVIEVLPHTQPWEGCGFTMSSYVHECGTPACIAGWAADLHREEAASAPDDGEFDVNHRRGRFVLGLDIETANNLFVAWNSDGLYLSEVTPAHAAAVLRHLAETGKVDWSVTAPVKENEDA